MQNTQQRSDAAARFSSVHERWKEGEQESEKNGNDEHDDDGPKQKLLALHHVCSGFSSKHWREATSNHMKSLLVLHERQPVAVLSMQLAQVESQSEQNAGQDKNSNNENKNIGSKAKSKAESTMTERESESENKKRERAASKWATNQSKMHFHYTMCAKAFHSDTDECECPKMSGCCLHYTKDSQLQCYQNMWSRKDHKLKRKAKEDKKVKCANPTATRQPEKEDENTTNERHKQTHRNKNCFHCTSFATVFRPHTDESHCTNIWSHWSHYTKHKLKRSCHCNWSKSNRTQNKSHSHYTSDANAASISTPCVTASRYLLFRLVRLQDKQPVTVPSKQVKQVRITSWPEQNTNGKNRRRRDKSQNKQEWRGKKGQSKSKAESKATKQMHTEAKVSGITPCVPRLFTQTLMSASVQKCLDATCITRKTAGCSAIQTCEASRIAFKTNVTCIAPCMKRFFNQTLMSCSV